MLRALAAIGWTVKRQTGSHRTLSRDGWPDYVFAFQDGEEIGPRMLARIGPDDTAKAGGRTWTRTEGEAVAEFRQRVLGEAKAAGARVLVWG